MNQTTTSTKILYADDDCDDHFFLRESITCTGLPADIVYLTDGDQVIHYLEKAGDDLPSLIVLDLNMPRMNGTQTLRYLKSDERYKDVTVIIYSTSVNPLERETCLELGAHSYVVKPTLYQESLETVTHFSNLSRQLTLG